MSDAFKFISTGTTCMGKTNWILSTTAITQACTSMYLLMQANKQPSNTCTCLQCNQFSEELCTHTSICTKMHKNIPIQLYTQILLLINLGM